MLFSLIILTDKNECAPNPCLHGGKCTDRVNGYTCACATGFTGNNCQIALTSCRSYVENGLSTGNGFYKIRPKCDVSRKPIEVYCDQKFNGGGWMRLQAQEQRKVCHKYDGFSWTPDLVKCLGLVDEIKEFGVSNCVFTVDSNSQTYTKVSWSLGKGLGVGPAQVIANLASCKTPTGSKWCDGYTGGYAYLSGTLATTNGDHPYIDSVCGRSIRIGSPIKIRFGGSSGHAGEFVYNGENCSGYSWVDSKWDTSWNSWIRGIWAKL